MFVIVTFLHLLAGERVDRPADHLPDGPDIAQGGPGLRPQDRSGLLERRELQRGHGDPSRTQVRYHVCLFLSHCRTPSPSHLIPLGGKQIFPLRGRADYEHGRGKTRFWVPWGESPIFKLPIYGGTLWYWAGITPHGHEKQEGESGRKERSKMQQLSSNIPLFSTFSHPHVNEKKIFISSPPFFPLFSIRMLLYFCAEY